MGTLQQRYAAAHMIRKGRARWVGNGEPLAQLQFIDELFWADDLTLASLAEGRRSRNDTRPARQNWSLLGHHTQSKRSFGGLLLGPVTTNKVADYQEPNTK